MARKETLDLLIEGGKAAPGANSAPKLSALKMNVGEIFKQINDKTKPYAGMQVPVKVIMYPDDKTFEVVVGTPPVSSLIKKEMKVELAKITEEEKTAGKTSVGDIKMEQIVNVAKMKQDALFCRSLKACVKQVVGTCASMPITVEGKKPIEVIKEIDAGAYDSIIQ
ncbi:MAG: 50S ribosomal protein L11 [Candidatus Aenigmarchaeota archaeon]|nr:50S ribosomal protein L11 [Candidatus Aenigmarchaeota archaeon]